MRSFMKTRILNGYRVIYMPDHPSAMKSDNWNGYIYEHIAIAEERLGRKISKDEVCHHLDGNRQNNDSDNVIVILRSEHSKLHAFLKRSVIINESSDENGVNSGKPKVYCTECGISTKNDHFCSLKCQQQYNRKDWPSREQLEIDVNSMSMVSVGKKYGISDNAIRKRCKALGIILWQS